MPAFLMSHILPGLDTAYTSRVPLPDGKGKQKGKNAPEEKKSLETVMVSRLFLVDDTGLEKVFCLPQYTYTRKLNNLRATHKNIATIRPISFSPLIEAKIVPQKSFY